MPTDTPDLAAIDASHLHGSIVPHGQGGTSARQGSEAALTHPHGGWMSGFEPFRRLACSPRPRGQARNTETATDLARLRCHHRRRRPQRPGLRRLPRSRGPQGKGPGAPPHRWRRRSYRGIPPGFPQLRVFLCGQPAAPPGYRRSATAPLRAGNHGTARRHHQPAGGRPAAAVPGRGAGAAGNRPIFRSGRRAFRRLRRSHLDDRPGLARAGRARAAEPRRRLARSGAALPRRQRTAQAAPRPARRSGRTDDQVARRLSGRLVRIRCPSKAYSGSNA